MEVDDDWLQKLDLEAIVHSAEEMSGSTQAVDKPNAVPCESSCSSAVKQCKRNAPSPLKLHKPVKKIPVQCTFLTPKTNAEVDDSHFKRYVFTWFVS